MLGGPGSVQDRIHARCPPTRPAISRPFRAARGPVPERGCPLSNPLERCLSSGPGPVPDRGCPACPRGCNPRTGQAPGRDRHLASSERWRWALCVQTCQMQGRRLAPCSTRKASAAVGAHPRPSDGPNSPATASHPIAQELRGP
jgi:hypothetical protein